MEEIWKDIEEYEGLYQVSTLGRVKTLPLKKPLPRGGFYWTKERIRKLDNRRGYPCTKLHKDYGYKHQHVHRLVAQAFIPNPDNLPFVNHKDSDKTNPHVNNLEWCTQSDNVQHAIASGTFPVGSRRYNSKFTEKDVICIKELRQSGKTYKEIATQYQVTLQCIYNMCAGLTWKHLK